MCLCMFVFVFVCVCVCVCVYVCCAVLCTRSFVCEHMFTHAFGKKESTLNSFHRLCTSE